MTGRRKVRIVWAIAIALDLAAFCALFAAVYFVQDAAALKAVACVVVGFVAGIVSTRSDGIRRHSQKLLEDSQ